jgi:Bacterial Ig-like domain (group 3)/FG-GAP-like repeat
VAVTDFNGDGIPDLAVSNRFDNTVTVLLGNGDGTFTIKSSPSVGNFPLSVAVADFNGDGISDLATANIGDNTVTVLLSQITQTATATLKNTVVQSGQIHQVEASYLGDMNYHSSTSSTVPLLAAKIVPALELNSNRNPSPFYGDQITLTATLNPYSLGSFVTDGEIVTFYNSGTIIGTGMLSSGVATLNISSLPIGTDKLTAVYAGDNSFTAVTSNTLAQQVNDEPFPGFVVNVNTDTTTGVASNCTRADSSNCSLRDALAAAAAAGAGNITFDPAVFGTPQTIILAASLNVASNTTITGIASGSVPNVINLVTVSGNNQFTVFTILSGAVNVAISYLNISGGTPQNLSNDGVLTLNGCSVSGAIFHGISNGGMLAVLNSTISGNVAYSQEFPQMSGGGIVNAGTAKVINSTIQGNYATVFGGGIYNTGTLTLADSTVANNTIIVPYFTTEGGGAGISNQGTLVVSNSLFEYNTTAYAAYDGVPQLDDCQGSNCPVQGMNGNQVYSYLLTVSPICAGVLGDIPAGVTTDQRGVPRTTVTARLPATWSVLTVERSRRIMH